MNAQEIKKNRKALDSTQTLIENYINGNITTARGQAKRKTVSEIREMLRFRYGYSFEKATLTAEFLKTGEGYQEACDAE